MRSGHALGETEMRIEEVERQGRIGSLSKGEREREKEAKLPIWEM